MRPIIANLHLHCKVIKNRNRLKLKSIYSVFYTKNNYRKVYAYFCLNICFRENKWNSIIRVIKNKKIKIERKPANKMVQYWLNAIILRVVVPVTFMTCKLFNITMLTINQIKSKHLHAHRRVFYNFVTKGQILWRFYKKNLRYFRGSSNAVIVELWLDKFLPTRFSFFIFFFVFFVNFLFLLGKIQLIWNKAIFT